jgi:N-acetylglucosaminyldiphosphoundecaprenol N-acetyl-beta-D-mannosaminyltransferase
MDVVNVGPFKVADCARDALIEGVTDDRSPKRVVYALHVGGLNVRDRVDYVAAMNNGDYVYADGTAVVALAKLGGARHVQRAATTDIGLDLLRAEGGQLGRDPRIAVIGGPAGLAEAAGGTLTQSGVGNVVYVSHGYHRTYDDVLSDLREVEPDVVIVGMGMPREAIWVDENRDHLPDALIMTCGGWLGFLAGTERRAPSWMQRTGLEWAYRLWQSPRRLWSRYATGVWTSMSIAPSQFYTRRREDRAASY